MIECKHDFQARDSLWIVLFHWQLRDWKPFVTPCKIYIYQKIKMREIEAFILHIDKMRETEVYRQYWLLIYNGNLFCKTQYAFKHLLLVVQPNLLHLLRRYAIILITGNITQQTKWNMPCVTIIEYLMNK